MRTLSSERPGGREGEEGSSRPRGFFGLGGTASEVEEVAGGTAGSDRNRETNRRVFIPTERNQESFQGLKEVWTRRVRRWRRHDHLEQQVVCRVTEASEN